ACQLLIAPWTAPDQPIHAKMFFLLAAMPALCHGLSVAHVLRHSAQSEPFDETGARSMLRFTGLAGFALAVGLGFLAYRNYDLLAALHRLSVLVAMAGMPFVAGGVLVQRRLPEDAERALLRTAGTVVALAGLVLMLAAVILAWPLPGAVIIVCA